MAMTDDVATNVATAEAGVREAAARVRFFITCEHTEEQIADAVATVAEIVRDTAPRAR